MESNVIYLGGGIRLNTKVCIADKIACGKSTITEAIALHTGFPRISFGNVLREYSEEQDLPQTREALQDLGQEILDEYGYEGFLEWTIEHSPNINWNGPLLIDGLRHPVIYECILEMFLSTILVYCNCNVQMQIDRIVARDRITKEEALKIISHPTEKYIQDIKPYADIIYQSGSNISGAIRQLDKLMLNFYSY